MNKIENNRTKRLEKRTNFIVTLVIVFVKCSRNLDLYMSILTTFKSNLSVS